MYGKHASFIRERLEDGGWQGHPLVENRQTRGFEFYGGSLSSGKKRGENGRRRVEKE
jgi:hypothetical protein